MSEGGGTVLAFMHEVAGGRKLLETIRDRLDAGADSVAVVAPQNEPEAGQIVNQDEVREAALSRVEVTQSVLSEFGIDALGAVMDPDPPLALDDAVRAFEPTEILISCVAETRFGLLRRDLVEWARSRYDAPVTHIPVRIELDAVNWDVVHTLVVATQTVDSPNLLKRLSERAAERPHRYTIISPRSGEVSREEVCDRLARTLAELYKDEIDATGQPMSPEPVAAVQNAIEHYRINEILVSTLSGKQSKWLEDGLLDQIGEMTKDPVEHVESTPRPAASSASRPGAAGSRKEPVGA